MDYEQFFAESKNDECNCYNQVKFILLGMSCLALLVDCIYSCKMRRNINELKIENKTLKNVILTSIDQTFTKILKNGNELNEEHDD